MKRAIQSRADGFSLLEILIAIVVLSVGLLGLVGLQSSALQMNSSATSRSIATDYANAMIDKVRTNNKGAKEGNYSVSAANGGTQLSSGGTINPSDYAYKDTTNWLRSLKRSIPNAQVQSCRTADGTKCAQNGNYFMVCIRWGDTSNPKVFEANTQQVFLLGRL